MGLIPATLTQREAPNTGAFFYDILLRMTTTSAFTVRLAIKTHDHAETTVFHNLVAVDATQAAAKALKAVKEESGFTGWVLDGPVERTSF